jgi:hypothetical protein
VPGTGGPRISGGCRPGTCGACHRDHPSIAGTAARRAGLDAGLAGLARDTGILSRRCRTTRRNILPKPALPASYRKTNMTEIRAAASSSRTTLRGARGGSDAVRRPVIQRAAGFANTRRRPCPAMSGGRAGFAETGPGVPGAGAGTRPRCSPGACPRARPARIHHGLGAAGRPTGRAGRLTAETSQVHHDNRAAPVVTLGHRENPGRPGQHA